MEVFTRSQSVSATDDPVLVDLIGLAHTEAHGEHLLVDGSIVTRLRHELQRVQLVVTKLLLLHVIKRDFVRLDILGRHLQALFALL